ncbi:MAG TPA: DegT/DnrJ/EryC1/StrS family aminotransferase [Vicinamibacterales bacterium]|nr:DegT/DnrJ/EryC1/StrS family aminotransferase [Vicinamibacterales bacterium]
MTAWRVPFNTLTPGADRADVQAAVDRVVSSGWYVLGPEVDAFESEFASAMGAAHAVGVGCGTDALALVLRALGIGPGDEVITTPLSAAYTALAILMVGARPIFADIDPDRLTIDARQVDNAIGPHTRAIVPVHLYGQPADMIALQQIAERHHLALVEDCCQAHLATATGRPVGTFGVAGAFSFYPTKNLGALGDGGAVITNDEALATRLRRLRNGGQVDRYHHQEPGVNSRLDELQAAVLRARLPRLAAWTERRRQLAARYRRALRDVPAIDVPPERDAGHVYHLFVIRVRSSRPRHDARDALQASLRARGIETLIHYPVPIPSQPALAGADPAFCPEASRACGEVLSLPLHHGLVDEDVDAVCASVQGESATLARSN